MKKVILFDLDNTLYPYLPCHQAGLRAAARASSLPLSPDGFRRRYEAARRATHRLLRGTASSHNRILYFQKLYERAGKKAEPDQLLRLERFYWKAYFSKMVLFEGVLELFRFLKKRRKRIAIVTDMTARLQWEKLKRLRLSPYLEAVVTSEEAGAEKPDPRIFRLALQKLRVTPREALFVGDDPVADMTGAERIGIEAIRWAPGKSRTVRRNGKVTAVSSYRQLKNVLEAV